MIPIVKSPQYERDLTDIWVHIALSNAVAADRVVMAIEHTIELLGEFPGIGVPCPHLAPDLRRTLWRDYLIYYRVKADKVEIVRACTAAGILPQRHSSSWLGPFPTVKA